ncbi:MAG: MFS transporter [Candidatus Kapabacteria bacterium]|nr:MFS transporter [Candidatus Kapabacteria bacterium]
MTHSLIGTIKTLPGKFWLLQFVQMLERLTYAALVIQMAVYIAQKDVVGGLHFEHTDKGIIFFFWALMQNLTPVFSGGFTDKIGRKKVLVIAVLVAGFGYFLAGFQTEFYPFLISVIILGFGLGFYRPAINGMIAGNVSDENSSVAWGLNVMIINFAVFFSPPLAKYLEEISWVVFFAGLGIILLLSLIPILFLKEEKLTDNFHSDVFIETLKSLLQPKVIYIVLILSGFMMIYMQFYETLPNFIYDWVDTSSLVKTLHLPEFMTMQTERGIMIDFKWLYNLNAGFIVLAVVFVNWMFSGFRITTGLIAGIILATLGLAASGWSQSGSLAVLGMLIYTLGEMITNPKFSQYMSKIAPNEKKSTYMGFMNLSFAIGLGGGSLIGGYVYKNFAEKSGLAMDYLARHYNLTENINHSNALKILMEKSNSDINSVTELLWQSYQPHLIWLVFVAIGLLSAGLLYLYSKKYSEPLIAPDFND